MSNRNNKIKVLLFLAIFTLPSNLFKVWRPEWSFVNGHFIDYLAPKIYLNQIIVVALCLVSAWNFRSSSRGRGLQMAKIGEFLRRRAHSLFFPALFFGLCAFQAIFHRDMSLFLLSLNFLVGPFLLLWWSKTFWKDYKNFWLFSLVLATAFQALLGIFQFVFQRSLLGYLFFGEPDYSLPGITSGTWLGTVLKLPYGTTPHPNILAAWLCLGIISLFMLMKQGKITIQVGWLLIFIQGIALLLTQSWTAWLSLPVFFIVTSTNLPIRLSKRLSSQRSHFKVKTLLLLAVLALFLFSLEIPLGLQQLGTRFFGLDPASITRRSELEMIGLQSVRLSPGGTGLKEQFQLIYSTENTYIGERFLQPIHNSPLFLIMILGIWIIIMFILYVYKGEEIYSTIFWIFLFFLPIFTLDHYITSTIGGQYILIITWLLFVYDIDHESPRYLN